MSARLAPAEEHAYVAARFAELADGAAAGAWEAPAPVADWTARDVVAHLVEWLPGFLGRGLPAVDLSDPAAAWRRRAADVQRLIEDAGDEPFRNPHGGEFRLADAIDRFYTTDVFMHTWDLARALNQEPNLDADRAEELLAGMRPMEDVLRASGQYGPPVGVSEGASAQDRLMGFIGRDPLWRQPGVSRAIEQKFA
jgi:uncharacterized protein (TIGR03086 family)